MGGNGIHRAAVLATLTLAGCASQPAVEVREIADPGNAIRRNGGNLAEAQAMLALGNPGLALEAFRKAQRVAPGADASAGIARCYVAMGRFDLARTNFEAALAYAPRSAGLLTELANVLERQGDKAAASIARADAVLAMAPRVDAAKAEVGTGQITVALPPPQAPAPAIEARRLAQSFVRDDGPGPRLERLSPGEVALVTTTTPLWARIEPRREPATIAMKTPAEPLRAQAQVLVLNAARTHRLAASARRLLETRGWRRIDIGDAEQVRTRTLVLYPAEQPRLGQSLATQLGGLAAVGTGRRIVVLLGRDSARLAKASARG